jgi:hypothetical protein
MKSDRTQIPNLVVYGVLYAAIFGISFWLLIFDRESPTNWIVYVILIVAVLGGLVKLAAHSRNKHQQST